MPCRSRPLLGAAWALVFFCPGSAAADTLKITSTPAGANVEIDGVAAIALAKVEGKVFPHLALADAATVQQGESVLAIGNPGGRDAVQRHEGHRERPTGFTPSTCLKTAKQVWILTWASDH